jgi:hypothetical protein
MKANCWAKGGGKEGQGPKKKVQDGAAMAKQQQETDFGAWVAVEDTSDAMDDTSSQSSWSDMGETLVNEPTSLSNWSEMLEALADEESSQIESWAVIEEVLDEEDTNQSNFTKGTCTEGQLYDLGTLCHMSPFRYQFISL